MLAESIRIVSDREVIRYVLQQPGSYGALLGRRVGRGRSSYSLGDLRTGFRDQLREADSSRDDRELDALLKWQLTEATLFDLPSAIRQRSSACRILSTIAQARGLLPPCNRPAHATRGLHANVSDNQLRQVDRIGLRATGGCRVSADTDQEKRASGGLSPTSAMPSSSTATMTRTTF